MTISTAAGSGKIGDLLDRDFSRHIEEIIKVNNSDPDTVYTELTEYVATPRIKDAYERLFASMAAAPTSPNEGVGVWISGFFGSGKSSFAKNLGYVLANRPVGETKASTLFLKQVDSPRVTEYVEFLNRSVPYEVFMFDVQVDLSVQTNSEQIAEVMYRVLLRTLDYAEDYDISELEIELEGEKKLDEFQTLCRRDYEDEWRKIRKGSQKYARASALLRRLEPKTYASTETWLEMVKHRPSHGLTVKDIVEKCFDLCALRRPGKAFAFVVDEMGQYVASGGERLENLRAVVEQFGKESLDRLKARTIPGPAWIIVTSQEKLQDVYDLRASERIDLPKLQDRFRHQIDLSPADIRQVATQRVLRKKDDQKPILQKLFRDVGANLIQSVKLERSSRRTDFDEKEFVEFYPYLPHLIDLSIDIMAGIRLQPNAPKHLGGSNRTIIKQSFEMLVSDRTHLADQPVGALVSIDKIYELVEGNTPSEKQKDILDIRQRLDADSRPAGMASRVAKAICLMEFAKRDLPRTIRNIAALLVQNVTEAPPTIAVEAVLERLKEAQFVRETEDGWKLQTAQEKNWEQEKRGYAAPNRNDRAEILRNAVKGVFESAKAIKINYRSMRSFDLGLILDGHNVTATSKGARIPVQLSSVYEDTDDFATRCAAILAAIHNDAEASRIVRTAIGGNGDLRDALASYLLGPFFKAHVRQYRKRPVYWLLQSPKQHFSVYLFHERATDHTLALLQGKRYLGGRIFQVTEQLNQAKQKELNTEGKEKAQGKRKAQEAAEELSDLDALQTAIDDTNAEAIVNAEGQPATARWAPEFDDGVLLNAAPLHRLTPAWKRADAKLDLSKVWRSLKEGEFPWAKTAMRYWPRETLAACKDNKSYRIAHGLE
jgi:hypothetical protein